MLSFTNPAAVEFSVLIAVGGCACPNSLKKVRIDMATCVLWYTPAVSDSAADDTTCRNTLHLTKTGAFGDPQCRTDTAFVR